jgi:hypothetical protein
VREARAWSRRQDKPVPRFQPEAMLGTHGSTLRTGDAGICPARDADNLEKLATALGELEPRLRAADTPDGVPFPCDAAFFARVEMCNMTTVHGDLDVSFRPSGTEGFDDLQRHVVTYDLDGLMVPVASLDDVINRAKDRAALPELEVLRDEIRRRGKKPR